MALPSNNLISLTLNAGGPEVSERDIDQARILSSLLLILYAVIPIIASRNFGRPDQPESGVEKRGGSGSRQSQPPVFRTLFCWFGFTTLVHIIHESFFLSQCFFTYGTRTAGATNHWLPPDVHFLGHRDRIYGAHQGGGGSIMSLMWMDYARADRRWAGSDLILISIELALLFTAITIALPALWSIWSHRGGLTRCAALSVILFSALELFGGWMVFVPEFLVGSPNLDLNDFEHFWFYLVLMNSVWVVFPMYSIWKCYPVLVGSETKQSRFRGQSPGEEDFRR